MPAPRVQIEDPVTLDLRCADDELSLTTEEVAVTGTAAARNPGGGLGASRLRDSLIDALLSGAELPEVQRHAEQRALAERLAALGAFTGSAGDEIGNHITRFIATTESFALALESFDALPAEIAAAPVLLTEICDGLARIAAIGRDLAQARRPSFAPPR